MTENEAMDLDELIAAAKALSQEKDILARTFRSFKDYGNPKSTITSGAEKAQKEAEQYKQVAKLFEELKQYRAIGTVEQLRTMFDGYWKLKDLCEEYEKYGLPEDYWKLNEMCKEYSTIGTVDELQVLNRIAEETAEYVKEDKKILEAYKRIGTVGEFKALKEKNEPKKVIRLDDNDDEYYDYQCPSCRAKEKFCLRHRYCSCGQLLEY